MVKHETAIVSEPRAVPIQGVGANALVFCECVNGRAPIAYLVDRNALTDEQWERLKNEAERWAHELSALPVRLRVI
jgi:hypothetical protein